MNKRLIALLTVTCFSTYAAQSTNEEGRKAYSVCSACHLPNGNGVAGAFPPLKDRLGNISITAAGRQYLLSVVLQGLSGSIKVSGQSYYGAMQAFAFNFSDSEVSAILNYVIQDLSEKEQTEFVPFEVKEVANVRQLIKDKVLSSSHTQRKQLNIE